MPVDSTHICILASYTLFNNMRPICGGALLYRLVVCSICADDDFSSSPSPLTAPGFEGSGGGDVDEAIVDNLPATSRLLVIHQEKWQQQLLQQFGEMALIDATYRTTCYDLALFFLVVPTNVGYTVVAGITIVYIT